MLNRETANVKRERARDGVIFPAIFIFHSFPPSPFINAINPINFLLNPRNHLLPRQLVNLLTRQLINLLNIPLQLPIIIPLLDRFPLIVILFTFGQAKLHFYESPLIKENT
jgi:hypothetical protein